MGDLRHAAGGTDRAVCLLNDVVVPLSAAHDGISTGSAPKYLVRCDGFDVGPPVLSLPELTDAEKRRLVDGYNTVAAEFDGVR